MEVIRGHLGCPLSGGCPLFGGSAIGGSTVLLFFEIIINNLLYSLYQIALVIHFCNDCSQSNLSMDHFFHPLSVTDPHWMIVTLQ